MSDRVNGASQAPLPQVSAEVRDDGTGEISVDGVVERIALGSLQEAGAAITQRIATIAGEVGRPVPAQVRDPDGVWDLLIHPDGLVDEAVAPAATPTMPPPVAAPSGASAGSAAPTGGPDEAATGGSAPGGDPGSASGGREPDDSAAASAFAATVFPATAIADAAAQSTSADPAHAPSSPTRRARPPTDASDSTTLPTLDDLLAARHPASTGPAEQGWRKGMRVLTFGAIKPRPGASERRERVQQAAVRRTLDGPRTIVVVNPKGGAHKTTATMLLAATFGLERGGYTLAWDNNETRGTLGWRSAHTEHQRTAVDLLRAMPSLGGPGTVRLGDLDGFVRTQTNEQFDVLASDEDSASAASIDADAFRSLHQLLSRFYRVLLVDTGNNMRASNWQAAIDVADQIVVVSTIREDTAQSAAWALDALRATGHDDAVRQAVTILSAPDAKVDKDLRTRLRTHFGALTRAVVEVPHDAGLVAGGPIDYETLRPATRAAWLHAAAVVADGL